MTARTPEVFIVGAGPVAGALAGALRHAGVPVLGLWGRRPEQARQAGAIAGVAAFSAAPPDLLLEADCVIVAVRDDAITQVARMLVETGLMTRKHVLLHCSGAIASREAFGDVAARVGGIGTLHPLRSIVDAREAAASMRGTVFGVEGDDTAREVALELVRLLGGRAIELDGGAGDAMALYHAAASIASNYLVALADAAAEALSAAGISKDEALPALLPLLRGTVENLGKVGLPRALTGPIARGDGSTIGRHLKALAGAAPDLLPLYRILGLRALMVSQAKGEASAEPLAAIRQALERSES